MSSQISYATQIMSRGFVVLSASFFGIVMVFLTHCSSPSFFTLAWGPRVGGPLVCQQHDPGCTQNIWHANGCAGGRENLC